MKKLLVLALVAATGILLFATPEFSDELLAKAQSGDAQARLDLGRCYLEGWGVERDSSKAVMWIGLSADSGNPDAQNDHAWCLFTGVGTGQNPRDAVVTFEKLAAQGITAAQYNLAMCLYYGIGCIQNWDQAYLWFSLAAANGIKEAINPRELIAGDMDYKDLKRLEKKATKLFDTYPQKHQDPHARQLTKSDIASIDDLSAFRHELVIRPIANKEQLTRQSHEEKLRELAILEQNARVALTGQAYALAVSDTDSIISDAKSDLYQWVVKGTMYDSGAIPQDLLEEFSKTNIARNLGMTIDDFTELVDQAKQMEDFAAPADAWLSKNREPLLRARAGFFMNMLSQQLDDRMGRRQ
jgi:hypothetical protein